MKRCPKCSRTFPDENQKFCTFDGGLLRPDQPAFDPNLTVRATSKELFEPPPPPPESDASEAKTSVRLGAINETIASFGSSTFRETTPVGSLTATDLTPPPAESATTSLDLSAHAPEAVASSQNLAPPPLAQTSALPPQPVAAAAPGQPVKKKKSILPWVLAGLVVLLLLGGGAAVAAYIFVVKPMMEAKNGPIVNEPANTNSNTKSNTNTNTAPRPAEVASPANANTAPETKTGPEPYIAPADAVQFTNSAANLDGELAGHYLEFSFYYPKAWNKDPSAGVPGASSFAKIDKQAKGNAGLQERVLFNWYPTKGSFDADADVFPSSARKISDQLAKALPNFAEVSHGETTINTYKGYEFRFKGVYKNAGSDDLPYWGRVVFLPPGSNVEKGGIAIVLLATALSPDVKSEGDVGAKGDMAMILDSLRLGSR
jgi:hypothetical protein